MLAWKKDVLLQGSPVYVWQGSLAHEWVMHEVIGLTPMNPSMPIAFQDYTIRTRILSGSAAGSISEKLFSRKALVFLSPKMGFAKKPSDKQAWKVAKHPRLLYVQQLMGLRWYGLLQPGHEYPPRYFEIRCTSSMLKYNRTLVLKRIADGSATKQLEPLVPPGTGLGVSDSSVVPTIVREDDSRVNELESCIDWFAQGSPAQ
jgi:hypothetical protein